AYPPPQGPNGAEGEPVFPMMRIVYRHVPVDVVSRVHWIPWVHPLRRILGGDLNIVRKYAEPGQDEFGDVDRLIGTRPLDSRGAGTSHSIRSPLDLHRLEPRPLPLVID